jgi:hypothetical protein
LPNAIAPNFINSCNAINSILHFSKRRTRKFCRRLATP